MIKTYPSFHEEEVYWKDNTLVIGIDEVGRGAFAGPIVAAAVIFNPNFSFDPLSLLSFVNDSKQVKPNMRLKLSSEIKKHALAWSVAEVGVTTINRDGIGVANRMVFRKAVSEVIKETKIKNLNPKFHLLVDGFHIKYVREIGLSHQKGIIKGDQKSFTIAAASILAKVHRDQLMKKYHKTYPSYSFAKNKGYGTKSHQAALKEFGICDLHRRDFVDSII